MKILTKLLLGFLTVAALCGVGGYGNAPRALALHRSAETEGAS